MAEKVKIELEPYTALAILAFLREYFYSSKNCKPILLSINLAVDEYEKEIIKNMTDEQIDDAVQTTNIHQAMGNCPYPGNKQN